ncbi:MAG: cupin domain-containing protein [Euryarchaeota archaeon]|nr:cupin domain-containing protein [Euryarchaeota archaeon]
MSTHKVGKASKDDYIKVFDGIKRKTLVYGSKTLLTEFILSKGKRLPMHKHPEEQTGYLVSGHIILTIDRDKYNMKPGDSWSIPNAAHGAKIKEDSVALEVFSPVMEYYIV